ncbi:serine protease [Ascidiaceihabitans donghaensis]|nr:serine protease [Ascidiaceihabitans donghaensis]
MMHRVAAAVMVLFAWVVPMAAQTANDVVWVQVEAQPSLRQATESARSYAANLEDVNGFALPGGWYGIALGPYTRRDAEIVLRTYRRDRLIPRDAYIAFSSGFRQQFWPVGANVLANGAIAAPENTQTTASNEVDPEPVVVAEPEPADETPNQARRSEQLLTADERKELQVALKWAGVYDGAIDGAYGRGTRNSMAGWQAAQGLEITGILTTMQRAELLRQYNAVLEGLGLQMVQDTQAGIEMLMPTAVVAFDKYESPFAHYTSTGDIAAQVYLISQAGDQSTLFGLYDIMQTLEIVPLDGPRERRKNSFVLVGENDQIVSETRVSLQNGEVKGFTLIWPAGDEARRTRLLAQMDKSFARLNGALDPTAGSADEQAVDLVAGLEVRKPKLSRSGFYVDARGAVVTSSDAVASCTRITLDQEYEAEVLVSDTDRGIALLSPKDALAPLTVAAFSANTPRLQSEVAVAGYSYEGVLGAASITFGTLADVRGLRGEAGLNRLALSALPGDVGGPVLDASGAVLGMLLPAPETGQQLPANVSFSLDRTVIQDLLSQAGRSADRATGAAALPPEDIAASAVNMTVLVSCWN